MTETGFTFSEKGHVYKLDGKRLTGVTTIIGIIDKPALIQWSANMAVDYIQDRLFESDIDTLANKVLPESRKAWARKRDSAGDIGSLVHKMVEIYSIHKIKKNNLLIDILAIAKHELTQEGKNIEGIDDQKALKMFDKFVEWSDENEVEYLLSEQKLYSRKYWYAGTVDLVIRIKGKIFIADLKTAKDIYNTNFIQMGGYDVALEELGKIKECAGYIVINIPKELKKDGSAKIKVKNVYNRDEQKKAFLNCVELYRFVNKTKPEWQKKQSRTSSAPKKKVAKIEL